MVHGREISAVLDDRRAFWLRTSSAMPSARRIRFFAIVRQVYVQQGLNFGLIPAEV
jgi:hypothetical protein